MIYVNKQPEAQRLQYNLIDKTVMMRLLSAIIGGFQSVKTINSNQTKKTKQLYMTI